MPTGLRRRAGVGLRRLSGGGGREATDGVAALAKMRRWTRCATVIATCAFEIRMPTEPVSSCCAPGFCRRSASQQEGTARDQNGQDGTKKPVSRTVGRSFRPRRSAVRFAPRLAPPARVLPGLCTPRKCAASARLPAQCVEVDECNLRGALDCCCWRVCSQHDEQPHDGGRKEACLHPWVR